MANIFVSARNFQEIKTLKINPLKDINGVQGYLYGDSVILDNMLKDDTIYCDSGNNFAVNGSVDFPLNPKVQIIYETNSKDRLNSIIEKLNDPNTK